MEVPEDPTTSDLSKLPTQSQISEAVRKDWSYTLSTIPDVISILGECRILTSVPAAARVEFAFGDNNVATLPSSLFQCNQKGRRAFIEAQIGMTKISMNAEEVAPIIDKVIKLMRKSDTHINKQRLGIQLNLLKTAAETCADTAHHMRTQFQNWSEFTESLALAVSSRTDQVSSETMKQGSRMMLQRHQLAASHRNAADANEILEQQRENVREAQELKDGVETMARIGISASAAMPLAMPLTTTAFLFLTATAVVAANSSVAYAESVAKMQEEAVVEEEKKQQRLVNEMELLQHEKASLKDIRIVLLGALDRLKVLQQNVDNLLIYFEFIRDYVDRLMTHQYNPFMQTAQLEGAMGTDEDAVDVQEEDLQPLAWKVKERFITMQRISQVYSEVSQDYVIPGFNTVDKIGSSTSALSEIDVRTKHVDLEVYRKNASENIRSHTKQRQKQLVDSMMAIEQESKDGMLKKRE